ncbi:MAG: entericidin A/B family lipoprotein [Thermodesulfovibrionales bacterium]
MKKSIVLAVSLSLCLFLLAGCNTFRGLGKDIEKGGEAIQKATE